MKNNSFEENNRYLKASKKVDELKGFYYSLISYIVVIPFLAFVNYQTSWSYQWFWWPMLGWGIGLVIQAFKTFGYSSNWEERKIQEFMNNDNN